MTENTRKLRLVIGAVTCLLAVGSLAAPASAERGRPPSVFKMQDVIRTVRPLQEVPAEMSPRVQAADEAAKEVYDLMDATLDEATNLIAQEQLSADRTPL